MHSKQDELDAVTRELAEEIGEAISATVSASSDDVTVTKKREKPQWDFHDPLWGDEPMTAEGRGFATRWVYRVKADTYVFVLRDFNRIWVASIHYSPHLSFNLRCEGQTPQEAIDKLWNQLHVIIPVVATMRGKKHDPPRKRNR